MRSLRASLALAVCLVAFGVNSAQATDSNDWRPIVANELGQTQVVFAPSDPAVMYEFGELGIGRSTNGGATWVVHAPACIFQSVAVDPTDAATLFAGCSTGGIKRSTDGGASWNDTTMTDGHVGAIAIAPTTPNTIYAIGDQNRGDSGDVYRSTDGGATWGVTSTQGLGNPQIAIDPNDPDRILITGNASPPSTSQLFTDDGGDTWQPVPAPNDLQTVFDPSRPGVMWGVSSQGSGLYKAMASYPYWNLVSTAPFNLKSVAEVDGQIYVGGASGLSRSSDGGVTWRNTQFYFGSGLETLAPIAIDPADSDHVFAETGADGLWAIEFSDTLPPIGSYDLLKVGAPLDVTPTSATLVGIVDSVMPNSDGGVWFSFSPNPTNRVLKTIVLPATGTTEPRTVTQELTGLTPGTTYLVMLQGGFNFPTHGYTPTITPPVHFTTPPAIPARVTAGPVTTLANGQVSDGRIPVTVRGRAPPAPIRWRARIWAAASTAVPRSRARPPAAARPPRPSRWATAIASAPRRSIPRATQARGEPVPRGR